MHNVLVRCRRRRHDRDIGKASERIDPPAPLRESTVNPPTGHGVGVGMVVRIDW